MKNILLGAAVGYETEKIRRFVLSFRKHNNADDVYLLIHNNINDDTALFLKNNNIKHILYDNYDKYKTRKNTINNNRYIYYLNFLKEKKYNNIILSDTRDVVFQLNPFKTLPNEGFIYFFEEDLNVGEEPCNKNWINLCFGESYYENIKNKKIICSGITIGSYDLILEYLRRMVDEISYLEPNISATTVVDQAVHIRIGYDDKTPLKHLKIIPNGNGLVGTIGLTLEVNSNYIELKNNLLYLQNIIPSIIHQYDRDSKLTVFFDENI